jgi:hypothetical protein
MWLVQELLAWSRGLERIVLTVQTANQAALAFYARQGYTADPTSPEQCPDDFTADDRTYRQADGSMDFSYRILCKERPIAWQRQQHVQQRERRQREETETKPTPRGPAQQAVGSQSATTKRRRQETTTR